MLRDGCLLVRGLVPRDAALEFAAPIDRASPSASAATPASRASTRSSSPLPASRRSTERAWIKEGGGVLAADSPLLAFGMLELFRDAGLPALVEGYLGEPGAVHRAEDDAAQGGAVRRRAPGTRTARSWATSARSTCGSPCRAAATRRPDWTSCPRRLDGFVTTQTDEAVLSYQVSQRKAEEAAGDTPIVRPVFEPGDALFFDELFLHQTGSDPAMPNPRFAIENWFFGAAGFPREFAPLAV